MCHLPRVLNKNGKASSKQCLSHIGVGKTQILFRSPDAMIAYYVIVCGTRAANYWDRTTGLSSHRTETAQSGLECAGDIGGGAWVRILPEYGCVMIL